MSKFNVGDKVRFGVSDEICTITEESIIYRYHLSNGLFAIQDCLTLVPFESKFRKNDLIKSKREDKLPWCRIATSDSHVCGVEEIVNVYYKDSKTIGWIIVNGFEKMEFEPKFQKDDWVFYTNSRITRFAQVVNYSFIDFSDYEEKALIRCLDGSYSTELISNLKKVTIEA